MSLERGQAKMRSGLYKEAAAEFLEVQRERPGEPGSLLYLAEIFDRAGDLPRALKLFTAASSVRPKDSIVLAYLAQVKRRLGMTEAGLEDLARAVALDRSRIWMTSLGYGRVPNREFYRQEEGNLEALTKKRPSWGLARVALGLAKAHSGSAHFDEIRADFLAGLAAEPSMTWTRVWLAEVCRTTGRHAQACALLDAWLAECPEDADALIRRGESRAVTGTFLEARADLDRAVALRPGSAAMLSWRGLIRLWAGDDAGALEDCDAALAAPEPALWAHGWRGAALLRLGRSREAGAALDTALLEDPADAEAWVWRGEARRLTGRPKEALADLDRALSQRTLLGAVLNRGLALGDLGETASAASALEDARRLGPALMAKAAGRDIRATLERALALSLGNRTVLPTFGTGRGRTFRLQTAVPLPA